SGMVRNTSKVANTELPYCIFDFIPSKPIPFSERLEILRMIFADPIAQAFQFVRLVETIEVQDEDLKEIMYSYIAKGYEGIVIRTVDSLYKPNSRSKTTVKMKPILDK